MNELQEFASRIWTVDGPPARALGFAFATRMTIVKLRAGGLWISSPVNVAFPLLTRITELGPVEYLVAATQMHTWRLEMWHRLFPGAQLWAARKTPFTSSARIKITGTLGPPSSVMWSEDLDQLTFRGSPLIEETLFLHKETRTLLVDDLIQIHSRTPLCRLAGVAAPSGGVALDIRMSFVDRKQARACLERLLAWDFDKVIIAHGGCIMKDGKRFVERAFRWLQK